MPLSRCKAAFSTACLTSACITPSWWLSLAWLALLGSVLAFACFLTLQDRLGPGPAGTVGVMTPLIALVVSLVLEGFRPDLLTALGASLAALGNALMLWPVAAGGASPLGPMATAKGGAPAGE
jgi:drug/metabolite transporter (DMT)-like permease